MLRKKRRRRSLFTVGGNSSLQEVIADFLSQANPTNWKQATLVDAMNTHLSTTTTEVVARLNKQWDADASAFDEVYDHILHMADALADGIIKQFPARFGQT